MYQRIIEKNIKLRKKEAKAVVIIGARQVGKTTLIKTILKNKRYLFLDGDNPIIRETLNNINFELLKTIIGKNKIIFIDEAQRIENIGLTTIAS